MRSIRQKTLAFLGLIIPLLLLFAWSMPVAGETDSNTPVRRVNIPYLGAGTPVDDFTPAVFWFGAVDPTSNYADVRAWYYDEYLKITIHIVDRLLWYDTTPAQAELTAWDAVSLYLDVDDSPESSPDASSYRFVVQLNRWEPDVNWQAAYRGNGSGWMAEALAFTGESAWRGGGVNDEFDDKGWLATFVIPFEALGFSTRPSAETVWRLGVVAHDRDDATGTTIPDQMWPEALQSDRPATWGEMTFGVPHYVGPLAMPVETTTVRQGLNGTSVVDAHVGGHGNCGDGLDHWTEWGVANYAGYSQINIQNQWDISDYPCFSKYYVTFPLEPHSPGQVIMSATLTMNLFGNAGGGEYGLPPDSYIQVLAVGEPWDEGIINWNNAPLATENLGGTWVEPVQTGGAGPHKWNVARAVADAYSRGEPLRLALYSADGERHSGKYFWSSDVGDWNANARPTLTILWGEPLGDGWLHHFLPVVDNN